MKRVETIHINGIVFSIEDDAFAKLGAYLHSLSVHFEQEQGGREIITDIEARISELFTERNCAGKVITMADVTKVIETLCTPEDIAGAETETESETTSPRPAQPSEKQQRRLYRDPDQRYLGGVCSGIAAWLGTTPHAVRLVFLAITLFYCVSFPIYFLLWIIIPKARTTAQKLEMRGEPVNINNIVKDVRESFSDPSFRQSFRDFLNEAGEFIGRFFGVFGRIIGILLGLFLFCWGICLAIGLMGLFFMQDIVFSRWVEWDFLSFTELFQHIISPESYIILIICMTMAAALVIFALLFWGMKLVTGFRVKYRLLHVTLFVLWLAAISTGVVTTIAQASNFAWSNNDHDLTAETRLLAPSDTLSLTMAPSNLKISNNPLEVYFDKDNRQFYGKPNLNIRKSNDGQIRLTLTRKSQGESKRAAYRYAENINYSVEVRDSLLILDSYFTVVPQDKWKFQTLDLTLYVPVGTVIFFDKTMFQDRIHNFGQRWRWSGGDTWVMTEKNGLSNR